MTSKELKDQILYGKTPVEIAQELVDNAQNQSNLYSDEQIQREIDNAINYAKWSHVYADSSQNLENVVVTGTKRYEGGNLDEVVVKPKSDSNNNLEAIKNDQNLTDAEKAEIERNVKLAQENMKVDNLTSYDEAHPEGDPNCTNHAIMPNTGGITQEKKLEKADTYLNFFLPEYGVQDFINERALWQKGTHNLTGEPGWFYFKIFFHFNDFKGLFGGVLNNELPSTSALRYLFGIRKYYKLEQIQDRMLALLKFTYTLSYINSTCPWFFIGISNMNELNGLHLYELTKEKSFEIICNTEAIDMRLNTLLDMYRYACYDEINCKEIIPENLRKFDMSIILMNVPIKYFQTGMIVAGDTANLAQVGKNKKTVLNKIINGINKTSQILASTANIETYDYKTLTGKNNTQIDKLSFQMFTLKNCEIDPISFKQYIPSSINNSQFFKLGGASIKIKYDRIYKHTFNEWQQMMYGSTGFLYDARSNFTNIHQKNVLLQNTIDHTKYEGYFNQAAEATNNQRLNAIRDSKYNIFFNKDLDAYKSLIDFSEAVIKDSLINVNNPKFLGNIYDEHLDPNDWEATWLKARDNFTNFFSFNDDKR